MKKLFIYGTLCKAEQLNRIIGHKYTEEKKRASLKGYTKEGLNILEEENASVSGYVISVNKEELEKINYYEGLDWLYKMIDVDIEGHEQVSAYVQVNPELQVVI